MGKTVRLFDGRKYHAVYSPDSIRSVELSVSASSMLSFQSPPPPLLLLSPLRIDLRRRALRFFLSARARVSVTEDGGVLADRSRAGNMVAVGIMKSAVTAVSCTYV